MNWKVSSEQDLEIPFKPARVILQDFTGVPAVVDLAAMRDAMKDRGLDPQKINPQIQVDLVILVYPLVISLCGVICKLNKMFPRAFCYKISERKLDQMVTILKLMFRE